jgi:hypothetical protein
VTAAAVGAAAAGSAAAYRSSAPARAAVRDAGARARTVISRVVDSVKETAASLMPGGDNGSDDAGNVGKEGGKSGSEL